MMANEGPAGIGDAIVRLLINAAGVVIIAAMVALVAATIVQELD